MKPGEAAEFVRLWKAFTGWSLDNVEGAEGFVLFRDEIQPHHLVSLGAWRDRASVATWRSRPEFQKGLSRCRQRCEDFRGGDFAEAARVARMVGEGVPI